MSNSWIDSGDGTGIYLDADSDNNFLQLKLKKPKAWKWELTTSRSSPNIAMPKIMLFDHKGALLADATIPIDDAVYSADKKPPKPPKRGSTKVHRSSTAELDIARQDDEDTGLGSLDSAEKHSFKQPRRPFSPSYSQKTIEKPLNCKFLPDEIPKTAVSTVKKVKRPKSWRNSVPDEIDFQYLQICEETESDRSPRISPAVSETNCSFLDEDVNINTPWRRKLSLREKIIEPPKIKRNFEPSVSSDFDNFSDRQYVTKSTGKPFHSNGNLEAPTSFSGPFERRASSFKEVRFKVHPASDEEEQKPREKRRCRRSNTNGRLSHSTSGSILERLSVMKCRLSSPELETTEIHQVQMGPRYFLRTSRAGTLVVAEESFSKRRIRRRPPKTSSAENVLSPSSSSVKRSNCFLGNNLGVPSSESQSMNNFGLINGNRNRQQRKTLPIRRHRSDGNILLGTSSDEESPKRKRGSLKQRKNASWRLNLNSANTEADLV